jgi:hypothetical protein
LRFGDFRLSARDTRLNFAEPVRDGPTKALANSHRVIPEAGSVIPTSDFPDQQPPRVHGPDFELLNHHRARALSSSGA